MNVEFLFDLGSPNADFAHRAIPGSEARTGVKFRYVPMLLGGVFKATNNKSPLVQFSGSKNKLAYARLEIDRFIRKHGLSKLPWTKNFTVHPLTIMRGEVAAGELGV